MKDQVKAWIEASGAVYGRIVDEGPGQLCLTNGDSHTLEDIGSYVEDNDMAGVDAVQSNEYSTFRSITVDGVYIYLDNQAAIDQEEDDYWRERQDEINYVRGIR